MCPPLQRSKAKGNTRPHGSLAQLVERFVYTEDVGSSSLSRPTTSSPFEYQADQHASVMLARFEA